MYGLHFDHHTLSIARDGELLAHEPLAVETTAGEPRASVRAALAAARGRPDEVSLDHWRELGRDEHARAQRRASKCSRTCARWAVNERIDAVIAVPADLDAPALASLRGALQRGRRGCAGFRRRRDADRGRGRRTQPLRAARGRLAFGDRHARRGWSRSAPSKNPS